MTLTGRGTRLAYLPRTYAVPQLAIAHTTASPLPPTFTSTLTTFTTQTPLTRRHHASPLLFTLAPPSVSVSTASAAVHPYNRHRSSATTPVVAAAPAPTMANTPPPYARQASYITETLKVSPSSIKLTPSPEPLHPYDSPTVHIDDPETEEVIKAAAQLLHQSKCVAFPTETVYGLGADACNTEGVKNIFSAKQRPLDNPLIVHVASLRQLRELLPPAQLSTSSPPSPAPSPPNTSHGLQSKACQEGVIPEVYEPLIAKFWPGPLTILLPLPPNSRLSPSVTAGQPTFAARLPEHPIALALCSLSRLPLAAPSANASGNPSPTTAAHVYTDLQTRIPLIIDGGSSNVGLESTVVDGLHNPPVVLRPGGISVEQIRACGGVWKDVIVRKSDTEDHDAAPQAPGMKYKHYSPRAGVVLFEHGAKQPSQKNIRPMNVAGTGWSGRVGFLRTRTWPEGVGANEDKRWTVFERSLGTNGSDISRALFAGLRELDDLGVDVIYVEGVEETDEGLAIMNRLRKAASVVVRRVP